MRLLYLVCLGSMLSGATPSVHDFGSVQVNSSAGYIVAVTVAGATAAPSFSVTGAPYSLGAVACSVSSGSASCTVGVVFSPLYPGLWTGALLAKDTAGHLLTSYFLSGTGMAAEMAFAPGVAATLAGSGTWGYSNGPLASSSFRNPSGLASDSAGNVYVADSVNQVVRKVSASSVTTFAGNGMAGYTGDNGAAISAELNNPTGIAVDGGNNVYIADQGNSVVRRVDAVTGVITTVAGGGSLFSATASNVPATSALLYGTQSVAVDRAGNLYISVSYYHLVMRVDAATNFITIFAGGGTGGGTDGLGDGSAAISAILHNPTGLALDGSGNLYIADTGNNMIRMVNASTGVISVVAGNGAYGYSGDGGLATHAKLNSPLGVRVDAAGNVYIADSGNNTVRQTLAATGTIMTLMGKGAGGYSGDGGLANNAALQDPTDVVLTQSGTVLVADNGNNVIRQVAPTSPALSFGSQVVGTATASQAVTLVNRGNQPLTLSGLSFSSKFKQVSGLDDCLAAGVLPPGGACTANMAFAPTAIGVVNSNLSFTTNSLNVTSTQAVGISGTGIAGNAPTAKLSAASLTFGGILVGTSQTKTVTLANGGSAALAISAVSLTGTGGGAFSLATSCESSLAAGASCPIALTFTPSAAAVYSATLSIDDSAGNSPQTMTMTGTGAAQAKLAVTSSALSFSTQPLMTASPVQAVVVSNVGNAAGALTAISFSGVNPGDFSFSSTCAGGLAAGASCTISVAFNPQTVGVRSAVLSLSDSAGDRGLSAAVSGIGIAGVNFNSYKAGDVHLKSDFDGDGKTDEVVWRPSTGSWYVLLSSNPSRPLVQSWGLPGDIPIAADFDGDGKADFAVWRPSTGCWYVLPSSTSTPVVVQWGLPGDIPVVGDFDGDGKADVAVWRPSTGSWYVMPSMNPSAPIAVPWGLPGDIPIAGDFDGDGKTDFAVWRPSTGSWYVLSNSGAVLPVVQWGLPGDVPMAGDYDGDGKTDFAVWRPSSGAWYVLPSSSPTRPVVQWGLAGDIPMTGDYDGDGKTDYGVWRASTGTWFIMPSSKPSQPIVVQWGLPGDIPL